MLLKSKLKNNFKFDKVNYLSFTGTSYLGLQENKHFEKQLYKSIKKWGASFGSSRKANIQLEIYNKAEKILTKYLQTDKTITLSSGTLASMLVAKYIEETKNSCFHLPKTHPSVLPKKSKLLTNKISEELNNWKDRDIVIIADAIPSLQTNPYDLNFITSIAKENRVILVIDLSHYIGIFNDFSCFKFPNVDTIFVSSLGKSFGLCGGIIASSHPIVEAIEKTALFIGAAGMSPAFLDCFVNCQWLYEKQRIKLQKNCLYTYTKLKKNKVAVNISKNYPVIYSKNEDLSVFLETKNIIITNFYYATSSKKLNRIVINAKHNRKQLKRLTKELNYFNKI